MAYEGLRVTRHGDVAELALDRPAALNAVSVALAGALAAACADLAADPTLRAVVVSSSSDRAFCVGADLKERRGFTDADLARHRPTISAGYGGVRQLPVPVVAAVGGYALGGGFELALACDLVVADERATFGLPEVTVGLVPGGGGTQLLARRIGPGRAADLILTGRRVPAQEAERLGIVDRRVAAGQARAEALDLARAIAANSPTAVRNAKAALRAGLDLPLAGGLAVEDAAWWASAMSADAREGIAAFTEGRPPRWSPQG